jgi:glycosyltransferase involved in cell wall biosynthesis
VTSTSLRSALVVTSVLPYPILGGGHKRTLRLLEAVRRAGVEPRLIFPGESEASAAAALADLGVRLEPVEVARAGPSGRLRQHLKRLPSPYLPEIAERLATLRARHSVAFVQFEHTQNAYYFDAVRGLPCVLSLHNVDSEMIASLARSEQRRLRALRLWNRWSSMRRTERRAAGSANAVLCVSQDDAERFTGLSPEVLVVPNGVDEDLFEVGGELPESERVLFFGQFDYRPNALGIRRFLRSSWPLIARERPRAQLRLAGSGLSEELAAEAREAERVEPLGFVESLHAELAASRLVVVPIWQGGGTRLKVLESMAAARPIAGTPLGVSGIGFEHDRHGLIADTPGDLASAVIELLRNRELAERVAAEGRRLAEHYRWTTVMRPAETLYRSLSAPGGVGPGSAGPGSP